MKSSLPNSVIKVNVCCGSVETADVTLFVDGGGVSRQIQKKLLESVRSYLLSQFVGMTVQICWVDNAVDEGLADELNRRWELRILSMSHISLVGLVSTLNVASKGALVDSKPVTFVLSLAID
ncbi:hypothetical protein [Vibrio breoganii]|uniref:hypothetical protein n=1 Tax=Vibrio breoganii TaxID=553239 RepID=UPI0012EA4023|nr:hypothetical protein [Vibrio breoganii]